MAHISIVTPVYKTAGFIDELYSRLSQTLCNISDDFEIIFVNDGSPDNSWEKIYSLASADKKVKGLNLSRNFGQHSAITAGLEHCSGEWIVVMDCDLQDVPEEIIKLYTKATEGFDIVFGRRYKRKDGFLKKFFSKFFYSLFSYLTDTKQDYTIANFGIYNRNVIQAILNMGDYFRVFPIMVQWVGFSKAYIDVKHNPRPEGKSGYTYSKLIKLAFDMIVSFSDKLLRIGMKTGVIISFISFIIGIVYLSLYLKGDIKVPGYTSLIISIAFSTGIIIAFLGLVGIYIGKISIQVKERPKYVIKQKMNTE